MHTPTIELFVALGVLVLMGCLLPWRTANIVGYLAVFVLASLAMHQQRNRHATCQDDCLELGLPLRTYAVDSTDMLVVVGVAAPEAAAARLPGQELFAGGADGRPATLLGIIDQAQVFKDTVLVVLRSPLPVTLHPSTPLYDGSPPTQSAVVLSPILSTAFGTLINVAQYIALVGTVICIVPGFHILGFVCKIALFFVLLAAALILLLHNKIDDIQSKGTPASPETTQRPTAPATAAPKVNASSSSWWAGLF